MSNIILSSLSTCQQPITHFTCSIEARSKKFMACGVRVNACKAKWGWMQLTNQLAKKLLASWLPCAIIPHEHNAQGESWCRRGVWHILDHNQWTAQANESPVEEKNIVNQLDRIKELDFVLCLEARDGLVATAWPGHWYISWRSWGWSNSCRPPTDLSEFKTIWLPSDAGTSVVFSVGKNMETEVLAIDLVQLSEKLQVLGPFVWPKGPRDTVHVV